MKDEQKAKLKKQILSGGLYIALAAAVVAITTRGVTTILSGGDGYESPDFKIDGNLYQNESSDKLQLPEIPDILKDNEGGGDTTVSDHPGGVNANVADAAKTEKNANDSQTPPAAEKTPLPGTGTETTPQNTPASAEPEYPTEPDGNTGYSLYVKPVGGYISKEFSPDELLYSPTMYDYRTHNGIDITADPGAQVKAFAAGKVSQVIDDPMMGKTVILDHGDGITSCYMNLSEDIPQNIATGAWINVGDVVGGVGETAICEIAEVPHLHFEIRKGGTPQDPSLYLRQSSIESETEDITK